MLTPSYTHASINDAVSRRLQQGYDPINNNHENEVLQESELFPAPAKLQGASEFQLAVIAATIVDRILESGRPLEVAEYMKSNEKLSDFIRADKRFVEYVREEAGKYGKAGFASESGATVKLAEVGTKYDYSACGCPILAELEEQAQQAAARLKQRQELLKCLPAEGEEFVDLITGEQHRIYPPTKISISSYKVELNKK